MVRAAGMPLNDGALAPGMLTVRVVEGAFVRDIANQLVELEIAGGKIESGRTGPDGRAQFAHVPVGARVRATVSVDGERLESESFEMPTESGVRLLLVASANAGAPASGNTATTAGATTWSGAPPPSRNGIVLHQALPPDHPPLTDGPASVPVAPAHPNAEGVLAVRATLLTATIFAFGIVLFRRPRR